MPSRSMSYRAAAIVVGLACFATGASGQIDESGASAGHSRVAAYGDQGGLDDAFQPVLAADAFGRDSYELCDRNREAESATPIALWEGLAALDVQQRANAVIELELGGDALKADLDSGFAIEQAWREGRYENAISLLREFEEVEAGIALGLTWKTPAPTGSRGLDLRIGGTRDSVQSMALDFDAESGNLFTLARWSNGWSMNVSIDGGVTWAETYYWSSSETLIDSDAAVVDDYVYVAYASNNIANEGRLRRCLVSNGAIDGAYSYVSVVHAGANTVEEVALATNADDYDNRIYYLAIQSNDVLRYFWDAASDGTTFVDGGSPAVADAEYGLDATWKYNPSASSSAEFVYVSYAGADGDIHVQGRDESGWTDWAVQSGAGSFRTTAISAYGDAIICAFEYPYANGTGIAYRISYACGDFWNMGRIAVPDGSTIFGYFEPDVDLRNGAGAAIIYQAEAGEIDPMYYRTRAGLAPGAWSDPSLFNDYDVYTGSDTALNHLPPLGGETFSHGALYISLDPDFRTPYFDRPSASSAACNDATPPIVELDEPATLSCACAYVDVVGAVSDPDGAYSGDRLEYRGSNDAEWIVADSAYGARSGVLYVWDTSLLTQDFYYVRVVGENECALTASDSTFVYKPTSFDNLELRLPEDSYVYGGAVCFDGSAWSQSCFDYYTADYRIGANAFAPVDPPESPYTTGVLNDPLASWDTVTGPAAVGDGDYDVRLRGLTVCGNEATVIHTVTIDNTSPEAEITAPAACEYLTGLVDIHGTVDDANLSEWELSYTGDGIDGWVTIATGTEPIHDGLLGEWDTDALPQCAYTLRLLVRDRANINCSGETHRSEALVSVNVGCRADINKNGVYDLHDLAELLGYYGGTCP